MNHDIISYTPIVYDDGSIINAYIHKLPSGWYAMHADYPYKAGRKFMGWLGLRLALVEVLMSVERVQCNL